MRTSWRGGWEGVGNQNQVLSKALSIQILMLIISTVAKRWALSVALSVAIVEHISLVEHLTHSC